MPTEVTFAPTKATYSTRIPAAVAVAPERIDSANGEIFVEVDVTFLIDNDTANVSKDTGISKGVGENVGQMHNGAFDGTTVGTNV